MDKNIVEYMKYDELKKKYPDFRFKSPKNRELVDRINEYTTNKVDIPVKKGFEPLWGNKPKALILGTFPGDDTLSPIKNPQKEYYKNSSNHFWETVANDEERKALTTYEAKKDFLDNKHIALWDIYKAVVRDGATDKKILGGEFNDIFDQLKEHPSIKRIFFNGRSKKSNAFSKFREFYKVQILAANQNGIEFIDLLSTSNANNGKTTERIEDWKQVFNID